MKSASYKRLDHPLNWHGEWPVRCIKGLGRLLNKLDIRSAYWLVSGCTSADGLRVAHVAIEERIKHGR